MLALELIGMACKLFIPIAACVKLLEAKKTSIFFVWHLPLVMILWSQAGIKYIFAPQTLIINSHGR